MFELLGLDQGKDDASFKTWEKILHREDLEIAKENIQNAIEEHSFLDNQYRIIYPDGEVRWIDSLGQAEYDENNLPLRMIGICIDITERKLMDIKLNEMLENLEEKVHQRIRTG
jgi:PAS domain S-box-containing protein